MADARPAGADIAAIDKGTGEVVESYMLMLNADAHPLMSRVH